MGNIIPPIFPILLLPEIKDETVDTLVFSKMEVLLLLLLLLLLELLVIFDDDDDEDDALPLALCVKGT